MNLHLPDLPASISGATYGVVGLAAAIIVVAKLSRGPNLDAIPTVGSTGWLGSWWAGLKYIMDAEHFIQEGYEKLNSAPFKIAEPNHWTVILSSREHIEELTKASDEFSFVEAVNDQIQVEHLMGPDVHHNPYHIPVIRSNLTRNLEVLCPEMRHEVVTSFAEVLDLRGNEWKSVPALSAIQTVVCRTSNRVFVGLPLCRDPDWTDLNIRCTVDMIAGGVLVGLFPKSMRSLVARFLTKVPQCINRSIKLLGPVVGERQKYLNEYGTEWENKPNDFLSWLMDKAEGIELTTERLAPRMLILNFAAIHTTSNSFTQALYYLAANPQYIQPLREEVEGIVEKDGWSKVALGKMRKVDSFLKECLRIEGMLLASVSRKAMKDFTFSDGTFIPKGTLIAAATRQIHQDKNFYENPDVFDPFRFVHVCEEDSNGPKPQYTSTSSEYLAFGHGKQACPGRFFAASEQKLMLAHMVMTYDVKLEDDATYPSSWRIGIFISANPHAKVMFRHRVD